MAIFLGGDMYTVNGLAVFNPNIEDELGTVFTNNRHYLCDAYLISTLQLDETLAELL